MRRTALVSTLAFEISSIGTGTIDAQQGPDGPSFKKMFNDLMADAAQEGGKADILYSLATKPFFIDPAAAKAGKAADGRLLPASEAKVLGREGDWLNMQIQGWQQEQEGRVMYALRGQRILTAAVAPSAAAKVERGEGVRDPGTDLTWYKAGLTAWISKDAMIASREKLWAYGGEMYASSCGELPLFACDEQCFGQSVDWQSQCDEEVHSARSRAIPLVIEVPAVSRQGHGRLEWMRGGE